MSPRELFQSGQLDEAVKALGVEVRDNPTDARRRTFLFELLCFQGEFDRAEKHLNLLADAGPEARLGAMLYFSALHAEKTRHELFSRKEYPSAPVSGKPRGGTVTFAGGESQAFEEIEDADPRLGARVELFAAGAYLWIPFEHIEQIEIQDPKKLRDLLWIPALVRTGPAFRDKELGEVLLPVVAPFSSKRADGQVRLGRATEFDEVDGQSVPFGQRCLLIDGEEIPLLEIRKIEFTATEGPDTTPAS